MTMAAMTVIIDVGADNNSAPGAHLLSWDRHGNPNQCFDVQFVSAPHPLPVDTRYDICIGIPYIRWT